MSPIRMTTGFSGVLAFSILLGVAPARGQQVPKNQASPSAVARASFAALKRQDIPAFVALFHPDDIQRFKTFAVDLFAFNTPDDEIEQVRKLFAPHDSPDGVASATGSDLLAAFLKNTFASIPGFNEILRDAKLQVLGEIEETPEKVHVITRTVLPRPSPVSCQKSNDRWYQLLNDETMRMITAFELKEHFRKKDKPLENPFKSMVMDKIVVLGSVKDGDDTAQALCRISMKIDDFTLPVFGCYPVRQGEPAWDHLNDEDKTKLADALRAKWGQ